MTKSTPVPIDGRDVILRDKYRAIERFVEGPRIYRIHAVVESDTSGKFLLCKASEELAT
ncbi:hypothetical protein OAC47_00735 [Planktomarina temperata]|nr:hypothetical protein [Planktomarina temperata]